MSGDRTPKWVRGVEQIWPLPAPRLRSIDDGDPAGRSLSPRTGGGEPRRVIELHRAIDLMQEAALVLTSFREDFRAEHLNDRAARDLGVEASQLVDYGLLQVLPADTAEILHRLCDEALRSQHPVQYMAAAPDPLTDLSGTASVAVRATRVDDTVVCTWMPWWEPTTEDERQPVGAGGSVRDRLELAATLDALAGSGFGVFSMNLMTGRLIWSQGMYRIFGRTPQEGPIGPAELMSLIEPVSPRTGQWQALLHKGEPLDVEVRLVPAVGGHRLQFSAYAVRGADGHPAVIRGRCCVMHN